MPTIRAQILAAMKVELEKVAYGFSTVKLGQPSPHDYVESALPVVFAWISDDAVLSGDRPDTAVLLEWWRTGITLEIYGPGDPEEYLGQAHKAMAFDCQWGGLALDTNRSTSETLEFDASHQVNGLRLRFDLLHRHKWGDPYNLV